MAVFKCKMCGGTIEFNAGDSIGTCDSCGTKQTLPRLDDDKKANLYDRANHFRRNNDFDKAMGIYEQILNEDNTDAEAYWSIVLCRYGIEYVEDPATHKRIPTVNRAQFTSIYMDEDYKSALQYADAYQKTIYEDEAKAIDKIQKGILEISSKEEPFDVFICYKETDRNGRRTPDSVLATELYHELTKEGFKVFFSRITLEDKLGVAYEPYIFAALNSAKVMVVVGTKPEYFNAVWVKNEWSRYLALIKNGAKKMLIPAYRDMDPYDLPEEFSHLQAQDMSKLGFMQDLIRGIKKIISAAAPKETVKETVVVNTNNANTAPLLERAFLFLEDGKWQDANIYCEKVLDIDPKNAEAYLGKLMAELQVKNRKQLANCAEPFDGKDNYSKVLRFGDEQIEAELRGYIKQINDCVENCHIAAEKAAKKRMKIIAITTPIVCVCIAFVILMNMEIVPSNNREKAYELYGEILNSAKVGDIIKYGKYEQDNNISNGKEDIEWLVLAKEKNKILVISDKALDCQQYNNSYARVTWKSCSLRKWMNSTFLDNAFDSAEISIIVESKVSADKNPEYSTNPGNETTDKVFLLSCTEAEQYFSSDEDRKCVPTEYAIKQGAYTSDSYTKGDTATCCWWLRSPGSDQTNAAGVNRVCSIYYFGHHVNNDCDCVRPAMWISVE